MENTILVVDDNHIFAKILKDKLNDMEYNVITAYDGEEALEKISLEKPELVILDLNLPKIDGLEVLRRLKHKDTDTMVIVLSGYKTFEIAISAMKLGAYDCLTKSADDTKLKDSIKEAFAAIRYKKKITKKEESHDYSISSIRKLMGESKQIQNIYNLIEKIVPYNVTVLIRGETGTGKELVARTIHYSSEKSKQAFISVDCASIPENLVESELFGYEKGAFTGASDLKKGKFELADKGTIFLDEIGNLPVHIQNKLLRFLQEREFERLGGKTKVSVDVRIIAATNVELESAIQKGSFRDDLFYRLNEYSITLPPLRERKEDILFLAERFKEETNLEFGTNIKSFSERVRELFLKYSWPGNVRELRNVVRTTGLNANEIVEFKDLPPEVQIIVDERTPKKFEGSLKDFIDTHTEQFEKKIILQTLTELNWNQKETAKKLKIDYKTLYRKIKKYCLQ